MEHGDITALLKEIQANQQSLHDDIADLANRFTEIEKKVTDLIERKDEESDSWLDMDTDPLYPHARQLVVEVGKASTSLLQRVFSIGYARAASLMDTLEENEVIGPMDGATPRKIILTQEEIDNEDPVDNSSYNFSADTSDDELYEDAKEAVLEAGKASTSYIQRKLRIGYTRAARLMDMLEEKGVVGPANGTEPRKVIND